MAESTASPVAEGAATDSPTPIWREWALASDLTLIEPVVQAIVALCLTAGYSARHCNLNVPVAITEALANAILRGNRSEVKHRMRIVKFSHDMFTRNFLQRIQ